MCGLMKAILLNSGTGSRLKEYTSKNPKTMVKISGETSIFSKAMDILLNYDIDEYIITTGYLNDVLIDYAEYKYPDVNFNFVHNAEYDSSNYIKSIDYISDDIDDDVLLLHGDLVFDNEVVDMIISSKSSSVVVDSGVSIPEKDFKAKVVDSKVEKVSVNYFGDDAIACQPLYKIANDDWIQWKKEIKKFCLDGNVDVYAEEALNELLKDKISLEAIDIKGYYCSEIDTVEDLNNYKKLINGDA